MALVTVEGVDGAGKSTHLKFIAETLRTQGRDVIVTREPGGTPVGEQIRAILLHTDMTPGTEAMLMFAARQEHIRKVILPALRDRKTVVCDRFIDSSRAFQGGGKGVDPLYLWNLESLTCAVKPTLTLLFDVPIAVARRRIAGRTLDRFESEQADFHHRVRAAYLDIARDEPWRVRVVDARGTLTGVRKAIKRYLDDLPSMKA